MNAKKALLAAVCFFAVAATAGMLTVSGCSQGDSGTQAVDLSGPQPKIAADETTYNFGTMAAGTQKEHQFVIRNDGEATLHIKDLALGCKCTKGTVIKKDLEPGESTTVDVTWKPEKADPGFQQILKLETNDPNYADPKRFNLVIRGAVEQTFNVVPQSEFAAGTVEEEQPAVLHGTITSRLLESFNVLEIRSENKLLSGVATPLPKDKLDDLKVKCGYDVTLTLAPGMPIGPFKEKAIVKTDIDQGTEIVWFVNGERTGPFRFAPPSGAVWSSKEMLMQLGQCKAADGKKVELKMYVTGLGDGQELELKDVKSDIGFVKLEMRPDPTNKARSEKLYRLTFEVAPGSPPMTRIGENSVKIHVTTNHPKADKMEFKVGFVSL